MRLSEIANLECCDACGQYFDAKDQRGPVCPACYGLEEASTVETCTDCGTTVEEYGNICAECMSKTITSVKSENFSFDKFMDEIVIKETRESNKIESDTPQRARLKRFQEKPLNRTRF